MKRLCAAALLLVLAPTAAMAEGQGTASPSVFAQAAPPATGTTPGAAPAPLQPAPAPAPSQPSAPVQPPPAPVPNLAPAPPAPAPVVPAGANVTAAPAPEAEHRSVTEQWWFWGAVGAVVVTTVVVLLVANQPPTAPRSNLGNMEAFRP